jgi:hypothetical protein
MSFVNQSSTEAPGIVNNDQGFFQNKSIPDITRVPAFDLAYLSNVSGDSSKGSDDVIINLNPICVKWCDFTALFFKAPSGAFWVNPANATSIALTLFEKTYLTTQNKCVKFNLVDQIKKAWSKKNAKNESFIPPNVNILLNRAGFLTKSLASVKEYMLGLSIDEVISALLSNNEIIPGNSDTTATVKFIVSYKNYFEPLDTYVLINFIYVTKIPCYQNNSDCFISCDPYSNDCVNCVETYDVNDYQAANDVNNYLSSNDVNKYVLAKKSQVEFQSEIADDLMSNPSVTDGSQTIDVLAQILKASDNSDDYDDDASSKWSKTSYSIVSSNSKQ